MNVVSTLQNCIVYKAILIKSIFLPQGTSIPDEHSQYSSSMSLSTQSSVDQYYVNYYVNKILVEIKITCENKFSVEKFRLLEQFWPKISAGGRN